MNDLLLAESLSAIASLLRADEAPCPTELELAIGEVVARAGFDPGQSCREAVTVWPRARRPRRPEMDLRCPAGMMVLATALVG